MHNLYSRFRPYRRELERGGKRVLPRPGDVPGSRTFPGTVQDKGRGETVKQTLGLEAHELFTQLVAQTNLVKIGPRSGLFTCFVGVEEGVVRVWRDWLRDMAAKGRTTISDVSQEVGEVIGKGKEVVKEVDSDAMDLDDPQILWVSSLRNTGIRFNVRERKLQRNAPILIKSDEDMPVSYEIEYDGMYLGASTGIYTNMEHRASHTNVTFATNAREVNGARRQLVWQSSRIWLIWISLLKSLHNLHQFKTVYVDNHNSRVVQKSD